MTHQRTRLIEPQITKALSYSPCIGILGMRQVGKSTLIKKLAASYHSFDDDSFLRRFDSEKSAILEHSPTPVALDEIQKHPPAFDALKFSIDNKKNMGRFLISGSVRFSSRIQIRESLTGRIVIFEMLPLSLAECHEKKSYPLLKNITHTPVKNLVNNLKQHAWATQHHIDYYLKTGGLPGICFRRDNRVRSELFEQHLDTLLRRDIHLVRRLRLSPSQLRLLVLTIATQEGLPANFSQMARFTGCSMPTVKTTIEALQSLFLVRSHGKTLFMEDAGLGHHLSQSTGRIPYTDMQRITYYELRHQHLSYTRLDATFETHSTRGGIDVPFFFVFKSGLRLAMLIDASESPSEKSIKSITWLKKKFSNFRALILTRGKKALVLDENAASIPLLWLL